MRRRERLILTTILGAGAVLRLWGVSFGLPHSETRADETTIVAIATRLLYGDLNPHFFRWPSLEFYIVSAIYRIGWQVGQFRGLSQLQPDIYKEAAVHAAPFLIVLRLFSAASGIAIIWLVYRLIDRLFDRVTAMTAAFFVAVAFLLVRDSHFGLTGMPMIALVIAALVALAGAIGEPTNLKRWALSGALSGLAASTNYNGALVLAAGLATAGTQLIRSDPATRRATVRGAAVLVGAAVVAFLCGTPYAMLDAPHFFEGLRSAVSDVTEARGIVLGRGWIRHLTFSLWYGLGAPLLIAGLGGMALLVATSWRKAVAICTFPLLYYLTVGRGYAVLVHDITPVVPFLCMTAAFLIVRAIRTFAKPETAAPVVALVAVVLALPSIARALAFDVLINQTDTRVLAQQWTAEHVRDGQWVGQIPPVLIYPDFGVARPANVATFNVDRKGFVSAAGATVSPDWIMVPTSPLTAYTVRANDLPAIASRDYVRDTVIAATHAPEPSTWFDQQDPFFVPFANFAMRDRPGPEIQIFRRDRGSVDTPGRKGRPLP